MVLNQIVTDDAIRNMARLGAEGDWEGMIAFTRHHFGEESSDHDLFLASAALLHNARMIELADACLLEGCIRWPQNVWLFHNHANLATHHRSFDVAAARWEDLIARHPESPLGLVGLALLHQRFGREHESADLFAEAAARYPDYVWAAHHHADAPHRRHDWPESARRWAALLRRFSDWLHAHEGLVIALLEGGRLAEAKEAVDRGLAVFPQAEGLVAASIRIEERMGLRHSAPEKPSNRRPEPTSYGPADPPISANSAGHTFKAWRILARAINASADYYRALYVQNDIAVSDWAGDILGRVDFNCEPAKIAIVRVTVAELGFDRATPRAVIYERALSLGLKKLPAWSPLELRASYDTQPVGEWLVAGTEPIPCSDDAHPELLGVGRNRSGKMCLGGSWGYGGHEWFPASLFFFGIPGK